MHMLRHLPEVIGHGCRCSVLGLQRRLKTSPKPQGLPLKGMDGSKLPRRVPSTEAFFKEEEERNPG